VRLTQLKLAGFKSFVDPTVVPVSSQLVGVVGPNGCGKSNIIDAVRWVLGESKASELRGESMQDVIFNGSGNRKPAARASVELVFDNGDGRAGGQWGAYAEISVRRVLTRDGASSYYVNNQQVRRKDVHDIFLGTGLGARGYAIIGQGMINRLIEARPEELRVFLEEAAGVSRYKERRRETENRLSDTRENLSRVEDILRELGSQLEKLESQAEVAQTYRALQAEGEQKQHALWYQKESGARAERHQKEVEIEAAQAQLEGAIAELRAGETTLEGVRQAHYAASDAVHAAQGKLYEANAQVSSLEADIRHVVDARNRYQTRKNQLDAQIAEWDAQREHCAGQIAVFEEDIAAGAARIEDAAIAVDAAQERLPELDARVRDAAAARDAMRSALSRIEQDLALAAQAQRDADRQLQALSERKTRLDDALRALDAPDAGELAQLAGDRNASAAQLDAAQAQLTALEARLPELDAARIQAQKQAQEEAQTLARLEARRAALVKLQEDVQSQGALQEWLAKHELAGLNRLWQTLDVEPGWETALEASLRERLAGLAVRNLDWARAFANDTPPARLAFYQLPALADTVTAAAPPSSTHTLQPALQPLTARLRVPDTALRALLHDWLGGVHTCADLTQALAARAQLPAGAAFVTPAGHLVDAHSVRFYAPDSEQAGLLARQREIDDLQREVRAQQLLADQAHSASAAADAAWRDAGAALSPARQRVAELTQRLHDITLAHASLAQRIEQSGERSQRLAEDLHEIAIQQEELHARRLEAEERFETLDTELAEQQSRYADAEIAGEALALEAENARAALRDAERSQQEAQFAEQTARHRLTDLQRNQQLAAEQSQRAASELAQLHADLQTLDEDASQAGLHDALARRAEFEEALRLARTEMENLSAQLRTADEDRLQKERSLEPRRARIMELQLQEQAARLAVEQYAEQLDAHQVDRTALASALREMPESWQRPTWLQTEVQRISRQIDALGAVNLAALDELTAARERKGFLDAQHADLLEAITTLEDAIRKIDRDTRDLLAETFNTVNSHFGELFPKLFGGGEARLTMMGDEILDSGMQVMAQPPGKRNSTIHLLSGGEKALTATALVFAFFRLNPAPFCLLDEVDAPLDDANTERYSNLVAEMSAQTQFLFISHNKIAMQMARQLIGVTMQEQGVSRIVAVDIDSAVQLAQAA